MATLERIRSKGVLLLVVVGLAMLAFIVGDFVNSGSSYFNQKRMVVGEVDGEDIKVEEFMASVDQLNKVYEYEMGTQNNDEERTEQIRQSVWETIVRERVLLSETEEIGLVVTSNELSNSVIGDNVHPVIMQRQLFADPSTGAFDKQRVIQFLAMIDDPNSSLPEDLKVYWMFWERALRNSLLEEKYNVLLSNMLVANKLDAELAHNLNAGQSNVIYAVEPYFMVPDSVVSVSDKEIKARYEEKKEQFKKQGATCTITYATFDIAPLEEDYDEAQRWINEMAAELKTTKEVASFVNANSDNRYVDAALAKSDVDIAFRDSAFLGKEGDIFGPVFVDNVYKVARLVATGIQSPDSVKLSHIYVADKATADSLMTALNAGADFAAAAKKHSLVAQTAAQGGEIGWLREVEMDAEVASKAFAATAGKLFTVEASQGVQIFKVDAVGAKIPKVKLAIVERELTASSQSQVRIYNQAKQFAAGCKSGADMEKKAGEQGVVVTPAMASINDAKLGNIKNSRQVVRWAFEAKEGAVSDVFECDGKFVVASVSNINKDDYQSLATVSDMLKYELINEKKADYIVEKAKGKTFTTLMAEGLRVDTLRNVTFETQQMSHVGSEPKLFALASLAFDQNPVKGNNGVYVFKHLSREDVANPMSMDEERQLLNNRNAYATQYLLMEVLKDKAEIEDKRYIVF